jgi:hypothetical protein
MARHQVYTQAVKHLSILLALALTTTVSAEMVRIVYAPALGTKTRYRMEVNSSAKLLDLQMAANSGVQRDQLKKTLESASSTQTVMDNIETVQKIESDGSRLVASAMTMNITSPAMPSGLKVALNVQTLYKRDGTNEVKSFKIDKSKTSKELGAAFEQQMDGLKNMFKQAANFGFYGRNISETPTEVVLDIPAPANAAQLNLKFKLRATYRLTGRTSNGGYDIAYTSRLEPATSTTKQNGVNLSLRFEGKDAQGQISVLPDGRIERMSQPMTMLLDTKIDGQGQKMAYKMQVQTQTTMKIVP